MRRRVAAIIANFAERRAKMLKGDHIHDLDEDYMHQVGHTGEDISLNLDQLLSEIEYALIGSHNLLRSRYMRSQQFE